VVLRTDSLGERAARDVPIMTADGLAVAASAVATFEAATRDVPARARDGKGRSIAFVVTTGVPEATLRELTTTSSGPHALVLARRAMRARNVALVELALASSMTDELVLGPSRHTGWVPPPPEPPPPPMPPVVRGPPSGTAQGPTALGTVTILTPGGWGNVYDERGRFLGQTPVRASLTAGPHTLSLRPFAQPPAQTIPIVVQPGQTTRVVHPVTQ